MATEKDKTKTIEKNKKLVEKYPFLLFAYDPMFDEDIPEERIYEFTWLDDIDPGWQKAFGEDFCDELLQALKDDDFLDEFQFLQIKEKYGSLRIYYNGHPVGKTSTRDVIAKYEELSRYICGHCGKPARYITKGWIYPLCEDCISKVQGGYVPIEEFYGFDNYNGVLKEIDEIKNNFQYDRYWKSI